MLRAGASNALNSVFHIWGRTERTDRGSLSPRSAIRAATMVVIPVRPGFFDLAAVRETVPTARELNKPYAVVINAAPVNARTRRRRR
jgi:cellulose biosynthesis protein BcsQ